MREFDYDLDYKNLDLRAHPELYRVGRGEQGVLLVEPYKSEILPHWRFATPDMAKESSETIYQMFLDYLAPMTSSVPIWHVNLFKWAIPAPAATPTTKVARNTKDPSLTIKKAKAAPMAVKNYHGKLKTL